MNGASDINNLTSDPFSTMVGLYYPYLIAAVVIVITLYIVMYIRRPMVRNKIHNTQVSGMTIGDIDRMRKEGLLSEEEFRRVRRKMSEREVSSMLNKTKLDAQSMILEAAKTDPSAALQLLTPEERAIVEARKKKAAAEAAQGEWPTDAHPTQAMGAAARADQEAIRIPIPPEPAMNMTRVVEERRRAQAAQELAEASNAGQTPSEGGQAGELDVLLQKGAISQAEYDRLKKFFK